MTVSESMEHGGLLVRAESSVGMLDTKATAEELLTAMQVVAALKARTREINERLEEAAIAWIQQNGEISDGAVRYYVGPTKTVKCRDLAEAVQAVMAACEGDYQRFVSVLSTGALKQGACKTLLGKDWEKHFKIEVKADLLTGEVKPKLNSVPVLE